MYKNKTEERNITICRKCKWHTKAKLTYAVDPRLGANDGNVTKDGTKKTGNHFANTRLPGDNKS